MTACFDFLDFALKISWRQSKEVQCNWDPVGERR